MVVLSIIGIGMVPSIIDVWGYDREFCSFSPPTQYTHILRHPNDTQKVSMATANNKQPQAVFFKITSSLLKLANYGAHGDETSCAYVFHCFHDNCQQKMPYNYFFTSQTCKLCNAWS